MKAHFVLALCLAGMLTGCVQLRLAGIVEDGDRMSSLPPSAQITMVEAAHQAYLAEANDESRVRLALLLSLAGDSLRDDALALQLLEPYSRPGAVLDPIQRFAALLHMQIAGRILDQKKQARLREQLGAERKRLEQMKEQLSAEQKRLSLREAQASKVADLIAYARDISNLPAQDQQREFQNAERAYSQAANEESAVRLALLLSLPGTAFQDDGRAAAMLEPFVAQNQALTPMRQLVALLQQQASDRLREKKRIAQLQERLEALRQIERSLIKRRQED